MAAYYGDSSALTKRYVREIGSAWVIALTDPAAGHRIYTALVSGAEIVAALTRRTRIGPLPAAAAAAAIAAFRGQFHAWFGVVRVTDGILERAMDLAERYAVRGYDAIQLACAPAVRDVLVAAGGGPLPLLSADNNLNAAAAAEGLLADDPNAHP